MVSIIPLRLCSCTWTLLSVLLLITTQCLLCVFLLGMIGMYPLGMLYPLGICLLCASAILLCLPILVHVALTVYSRSSPRSVSTIGKRQPPRQRNKAAHTQDSASGIVQAILELASAARHDRHSPELHISGQGPQTASAWASLISAPSSATGLACDQSSHVRAANRPRCISHPYRGFKYTEDQSAPDSRSALCDAGQRTDVPHPEPRVIATILAGPGTLPASWPAKGRPRTLQLPMEARALLFPAGRGGGSLKAPTGLSRCTVVEDAPYPPPDTQVVMELHEKTIRVRWGRLRYRGFRPTDRLVMPAHPATTPMLHQPPYAGYAALPGAGVPGLSTSPRAASTTAHAPEALHALPEQPRTQPGTAPQPSARCDCPPDDFLSRSQPNHYHHYQQLQGQHYYKHREQHQLHCLPHERPHPHHQQIRLNVKVPWAEPHEVCPRGGRGLLESLNDALSCGSSYMVVGAAVRPGCTLLQFDLLTSGFGLMGAEGGWAGSGPSHDGAPVSEAEVRQLVTRLARRMVELAAVPGPADVDGAAPEVVIGLDGRLLYIVSYSASTRDWTAALVRDAHSDDGGDGKGEAAVADVGAAQGHPAVAPGIVRRLLRGCRGGALRAWAIPPAVSLPPQPLSPPSGGDEVATGVLALWRHGLDLTVFLEVPDIAAALLLAEALRSLSPLDSGQQRWEQTWADEDEDEEGKDEVRQQQQHEHEQQQGRQEWRRHVGPAEWQVVANCLGRSLPVTVLQVLPIIVTSGLNGTGKSDEHSSKGCGVRHGNQGDTACLMYTAQQSGSGQEGPGRAPTGADGEPGCSPGRARVRIDLAVFGCAAALEAASCRLGVLSLELWCGIQVLGQIPVMLVRGGSDGGLCGVGGGTQPMAPAGLQPGSASRTVAVVYDSVGCSGGHDGDRVRGGGAGWKSPNRADSGATLAHQGLIAELCRFAADASGDLRDGIDEDDGDGDDEDDSDGGHGQCVRQLFMDIAALELYAAAVAGAASGWGHARAVAASAESPVAHPPRGQGGEPQRHRSPQPRAAGLGGIGAAASGPLLAGSLDLSGELLRQLSAVALTQRRTLLQVGSNLLSYTVMRGMPYAAAFLRGCLSSLGCGLAEADALAAGATGPHEGGGAAAAAAAPRGPPQAGDDRDAGCRAGDNSHSVSVQVPGPNPDPALDPDLSSSALTDIDGMPLVHLAVLSGSLPTIAAVLRWAAEEGLGPGWVLRPHAGQTPLQTAAAAVTGCRGQGGSAGVAAYLAQVEALLRGEGELRRQPSEVEAAADEVEEEVEEEAFGHLVNVEMSDALLPPLHSRTTGRAAAAAVAVAAAAITPEEPWVPGLTEPKQRCAAGHVRTRPQNPLAIHRTMCDSLVTIRRHPLVVCVLGHPDPATEARFRSFSRPYDIHAASYWVPLMCFMLLTALLRQLRGGGGDPSEAPVSILFAWPYVPLAAGLLLRPQLTHRYLRSCFIVCSAARLSVKPLCVCGLLATPASMVLYTRAGVMLVTDTVLPALCERVGGVTVLTIRLLDAAAHFSFVRSAGVAKTRLSAVVHALLRLAIYFSCVVALERYHRDRFAAAAAAGNAARAAGTVAPGAGGGSGAWAATCPDGGEGLKARAWAKQRAGQARCSRDGTLGHDEVHRAGPVSL